jgi:hypothetical protein
MVTAACFVDWKGLISGNGYIVKSIEKSHFTDQFGEPIDLILIKNVFRSVGDSNSSHGDFTGRPKFNRNQSPGEFYMTIDDFKQGFKYYTITYYHDDWQNSFIEKRSSVGGRLYKFNFTVGETAHSYAEP